MANASKAHDMPGTAQEVRGYIRAYIKMEYGTINAAADEWGLSRQYVSHIVTGRASPPKWLLKEVGLSGTVPTPSFLENAPPLAKACPCLIGDCERGARECVNWVKRGAPLQTNF